MKFLHSVNVLPAEQKQRAPSLLNTHAFAYTPASVECVRRRVLHVIVGEMEWKTGLGFGVQVAGFRVTRSRSRWRLVLPRCFLPHQPRSRRGDGGGWTRLERVRWGGHLKQRVSTTPCPTGSPQQEAVTQPIAPTLLPSRPEPQPDPTAVSFTTLNHGYPSEP